MEARLANLRSRIQRDRSSSKVSAVRQGSSIVSDDRVMQLKIQMIKEKLHGPQPSMSHQHVEWESSSPLHVPSSNAMPSGSMFMAAEAAQQQRLTTQKLQRQLLTLQREMELQEVEVEQEEMLQLMSMVAADWVINLFFACQTTSILT